MINIYFEYIYVYTNTFVGVDVDRFLVFYSASIMYTLW